MRHYAKKLIASALIPTLLLLLYISLAQGATRKASDEMQIHRASLRSLMLNLYACNPHALQKNTKVSKEEFVQWVFEGPFNWKFDAIRNLQSIDALTLSFSPTYQGDRVLPLITGLYTMLAQAHGGKNEYQFSEPIDIQKLHNVSINVEISRLKIRNTQYKNIATDSNNLITQCNTVQNEQVSQELLGIVNRSINFANMLAIETQQSPYRQPNFNQIDISAMEFIHP